MEMRARPLLARVYVAMNRLDAAAEQVARCRQIMAAGEDWRGLAGDVAFAEAVVAAARGNYDIADRQFESALEQSIRSIIWPGKKPIRCNIGDVRSRPPAIATRAAEKFDAAIEIYRSRGVGPRFIECCASRQDARAGPKTTQPTSVRSASRSTESKVTGAFRREGEFWTISYLATTFRLKDAKGLRYIAYLLARPGQRIHVHDLIEAVEGSAANGRTTIHAESEDLEIVREIDGAGANHRWSRAFRIPHQTARPSGRTGRSGTNE